MPATAAALLGAASAVVWTYGRTLLVLQGASDPASTIAWITLGFGGTITVLTSRPLSAMHPARAWLVTSVSMAAAIAVLGLASENLYVAMVACATFGWGFVAASSALISWAAHLVPQKTGEGTSLLFITLVLGQAAGSSVAGHVAEQHGFTTAFLLATALALAAAQCGQHRAPRCQPRR